MALSCGRARCYYGSYLSRLPARLNPAAVSLSGVSGGDRPDETAGQVHEIDADRRPIGTDMNQPSDEGLLLRRMIQAHLQARDGAVR